MKIFYYSFVFLTLIEKTLHFDVACGGNQCDTVIGSCVFNSSLGVNFTNDYNNTSYFCNCTGRYITYPDNSNPKCNYQLYSQKIAFLLELFVSFGAGHF